jgi:hypothetical protein
MKITYAHNPLATLVALEALEIAQLRLHLMAEEHEEQLGDLHDCLAEGRNFDLARARVLVAGAEEGRAGAALSARVVELSDYYEKALLGCHGGDCTCMPCSCLKCHAESAVGIDTIPGLNKHWAYKIDAAFRHAPTCPDAIAWMLEHPPEKMCQKPWQRPHIERWSREHARAIEWLTAYYHQHQGELT